jgi:hypothetical protein
VASSELPWRRTLGDQLFRSNQRLTLGSFADLSEAERAAFGTLPDDPTLYGVLRDERGAIKIVDNESARLIQELCEFPRPASAIDAANIDLARLVLDGVLQVESATGEYVSGSAAAGSFLDVSWMPGPPATRTARLSEAALRYAQALCLAEPLRLSARLYFYGRLPVSPQRITGLSNLSTVERFLGLTDGGRTAKTLQRSWRPVIDDESGAGWMLWARRNRSFSGQRSDRVKLYVSPLPDALPEAFAGAVETADDSGAVALKVGKDAASLLRPDKIVLYFASLDHLAAAARRLATKLAGCPSHGVPFTAELCDSDGLLSWGMDPPRSEHRLDWRERESWRLWLTNSLALAIVVAQRDGGPLEPWRYAMIRAELEGIDSTTWAPRCDPWQDAA